MGLASFLSQIRSPTYTENTLVYGFEEIFGIYETIDACERLIVDQDRSENALLSLDIMRQGEPTSKAIIDDFRSLLNVHVDRLLPVDPRLR